MQQTQTGDLVNAVEWARLILSDPNVLYLDTETTGLDSDAEIVDLALVDANGRAVLDTLVRPSSTIPPDATRIHGITDAMVRDSPRWPEIAPRLGRLLANASHVVIYNADFDTRIMEQCNNLGRMPGYRANWQCAMKHYAAYVGVRHERYGGYRWHKLIDAAATFGVREAGQHRALADARLCRVVVEGMARDLSSVAR